MNLTHLGLVLLGALALLIFNYTNAPKEGFSWNLFLHKNLPVLLLNVVIGVALLISGWVDAIELNGKDVGEFWWFGVGFGGQLLFRKFFKAWSTRYGVEKTKKSE